MLFLPIRSEKETSRLPNLTIGLIILNFIIWIFTNRIVSQEMKDLGNLHRQLIEIEARYYDTISQNHMHLLKRGDLEAIHRVFLNGEIVNRTHPDYTRWAHVYKDYQFLRNNSFFHKWGFIPTKFNFLKLILSIFLHGSFFHVLGNMLYLWIVGCNMEDDWGWPKFLMFYLFSGIVAGLVHAGHGSDMQTPMIGASGAVAGVMGAFMIQHFKTKIRFGYFIWLLIRPYWGVFKIWAGIVLPFWFIQEYFFARLGLQTGTAHWAHVGGFAFGAVIVLIIKYIVSDALLPSKKQKHIDARGLSKIQLLEQLTPLPDNLGRDTASIEKLQGIIAKEPQNYPACLYLARMLVQKNEKMDSVVHYEQALETLMTIKDKQLVFSIHQEMKTHQLFEGLTGQTLYTLSSFLERTGRYQDALRLFGYYIKWYPTGPMRAKAVYKAYHLLTVHLQNQKLAQNALNFLKREYPDFVMPEPARS